MSSTLTLSTNKYVTPGIVIPGAKTLGKGFGTYWAVKSGAGRIPAMLFIFALAMLSATPLNKTQSLIVDRVSLEMLGFVLGTCVYFGPILVNWLLSRTRLGVPGALAVTVGALYAATGTNPAVDAEILTSCAVFAGLYLMGVILHEAAHAIAGVRTGLHLRGMALAPWGAACSFSEDEMTELPTWQSMFWTTLVGPLTSLAFGAAVLGVATVSEGPMHTTLIGVGGLNVALGFLNLIPSFPMDGGFVAAALRWRRNPQWTCTQATESVRGWAKKIFPVIGVASVLVAIVNPNPMTIIMALQFATLMPLIKIAAKAIAGDNAALADLREQERQVESRVLQAA